MFADLHTPMRFDQKTQQALAQAKAEFGAEFVETLLRTWEAASPKLVRELAKSGQLVEQIRSHSTSLELAAKMRQDRYWSYLSDSELTEFCGMPTKLP
jgi:hypothetical protein